MRIAVADIGASKVRAGMFQLSGSGVLTCESSQRYITREWNSFDPLLDNFLSQSAGEGVDAISIAVAGPVTSRRVAMTNLPWTVDADELSHRFHAREVLLLNDLVAHGYGVLEAKPSELLTLQKGAKRQGNCAVIAAGTGLGECLVVWDGKRHVPAATEGGHVDFSPRNKIEIELLEFLLEQHPDHVSWERVLSGRYGLKNIYDFWTQAKRCPVVRALEDAPDTDPGPVLTQAADEGDETAQKTLVLFVELYGAAAGNLALKTMATGGVFVAGGIARRVLKWIQEDRFLRAFCAKGRMSEILRDIPVHIVTEPGLAIRGLAACAAQKLSIH